MRAGATTVARRAAGLVRGCSELAEAQLLEARTRRSSAVRGAALVLHAVAPEAGRWHYELDPAFAAKRLDLIAGYVTRRYRVVQACELVEAARTRGAREPVPVAITFDDDLQSHLDVAAPILARHDAVATAFLCGAEQPFWWQLLQLAIDERRIDADALAPLPAALVDEALDRRPGAIGTLGKAIEDLPPADRDAITARLRDAVPGAPAPLSAGGRDQLRAAGWEIGFHTRRHDLLTALDDDALRAALDRGRDALGNGVPRTIAYPHGKAGEREARAAERAGFVAAFTGAPQVLTAQTDVHLIGRLQPAGASLPRFAVQLARALAIA